jgi:Ca2+-binding RTX toxin-like protein
MASVTVASGITGQPVAFGFDSAQNLHLAQQIAAGISAGVEGGTVTPAYSKDGPPPTIPAGSSGAFYVDTPGLTFLPTGYNAVIDYVAGATIHGSGGADESILSGNSGLTFFANGGSGTVVAGGGNNEVVIPSNDKGSWLLALGGGNDTVLALGPGNDTIRTGIGHTSMILDSGKDLLQLSGSNTVFASGGADTVDATAAKSTFISAESAKIDFTGGAGAATIIGGFGSETVAGGSGRLFVQGGSAGNNLLLAGGGAATLFGGGNGDQLFAAGSNPQILYAGSGNETLSAALANGQDTLVGGTGHATMQGGFGKDTFAFIKGQGGGTDMVFNFTNLDKIDLSGFGPNAVANALASQTAANGAVTITLSDSTKVTFSGITHLTKGDFS